MRSCVSGPEVHFKSHFQSRVRQYTHKLISCVNAVASDRAVLAAPCCYSWQLSCALLLLSTLL
jgi:hypothetical protein